MKLAIDIVPVNSNVVFYMIKAGETSYCTYIAEVS